MLDPVSQSNFQRVLRNMSSNVSKHLVVSIDMSPPSLCRLFNKRLRASLCARHHVSVMCKSTMCLSACLHGAHRSAGIRERGQRNSQLLGACAQEADRPAWFKCLLCYLLPI